MGELEVHTGGQPHLAYLSTGCLWHTPGTLSLHIKSAAYINAMLRRLASIPALAAALCAVLATDLLADILRNCCVAERRLCHPCAHWMRPLAAAEAWLIACLASEGGRLAGALKRGSCGSLCRNFDWFCASQPAVVRGEQ